MRGLRCDLSRNSYRSGLAKGDDLFTPVAIADGPAMCQNSVMTYRSCDRLGWSPKFGSRDAVQRAVAEIKAELG